MTAIHNNFWAHVDVRGPDECWPWKRSTTPAGYGNLWDGSTTVYAHRFAYEEHHGYVDPALQVMHSCDNPPCCNPGHLSQGDNDANMQDMLAKGRDRKARGSASGAAKLAEADAVDIRERYATGRYTYRMLAAQFNIDSSTISDIVNRKLWIHV